ncbi:ROK family protein [Loigolactobacillus zhaoyuanensis]|uniref:ROK family protein n=1 Tax=Loigolactobacillus zhaoyuanensis TaxID=2486017 RepID=A0ABW8UAI7_9LACO|nr:ROK family protein [Loigolactobacillus zhaoyuanensis]
MSKLFLAFDIGGTTIKYSLVDEQLQLSAGGRCSTEHNRAGHILKQLQALTATYQQQYTLSGIGISTAGIVGDEGQIQYAGPTIPGYQGTPLKQALEQQSGLPVVVVNDVDAALLGEQLAGAAQGKAAVYCVALGTGIGGAYLDHGQLLNGAHATANSLGYTLYDPQTQTNYEQRASTLTLEHQLIDHKTSVPEAFAKARQQETPFTTIINNWAAEVATGLANIILLFDPEILLIGGAVSQQGDFLLALLNQALDPLLPPDLCQTELRVTQLADQAQLFGAVADFYN